MGGNWQKRQGKQPPMPCSTCSTEQAGRARKCESICKPMCAKVWALVGYWSFMKPAFSKKGKKSVGVQRQYSGTAGRIENCQIGVFLTYAKQGNHTLVDRELYLPKSWTEDSERCQAAGVPERVIFATKPELAARMLWRTLDAGLTATWVTGDTVYGNHRPLRQGLAARKQAYALAISCQEQVEVLGEHRRVDQISESLPLEGWHRLSAGEGSKGARFFDWAWVELTSSCQEGWQSWLVVRRSLLAGEKAAKLAYVLVFA